MATVRSAAALAVLILGHSVPALLGQTCFDDQQTAFCIKEQYAENGGNGQLQCTADDLSVSYRMGVVDRSIMLKRVPGNSLYVTRLTHIPCTASALTPRLHILFVDSMIRVGSLSQNATLSIKDIEYGCRGK